MKFSVGKIKLGTEVLAKCTGITVRTDGSPVDYYAGGYPLPRDIELGNQSATISVDYGEWATTNPDDVLTNSYVDVELLASDYDAQRGISGLTIARCKATSYEMTSSQDGFITYRLELRRAQS